MNPSHVRARAPGTHADVAQLRALRLMNFYLYPFILYNVAFGLQAAYADLLIPLAQSRRAARDKAHAGAHAKHREAIAAASAEQFGRMLKS